MHGWQVFAVGWKNVFFHRENGTSKNSFFPAKTGIATSWQKKNHSQSIFATTKQVRNIMF